MGLTVREYRERTKGLRTFSTNPEKIDLIITGEEDTEKAKENMQRVMKSIAKPFMDMSSPILQAYTSTQRMLKQLAGPQLGRLLFPSLAIIERYIQMYREDLNVKKAYYGKLSEDDEARDIWLSEHLEEYKYSLEEGKIYRYEARKVIKKAGGNLISTPLVPISVINMELVINIKFNSEILLRLMPEGYWESKRGRAESYVLVNGKGIENMEDIEDMDNLLEEVTYIALKYLSGFKKLPEQRQRQFLLYGMGVKKYFYQVCGNKNKATVAMRTAKRRMEEEEYQEFLEGIEKLRALTLGLGREEKIIIGYLICLMCNLPIKIVTFF